MTSVALMASACPAALALVAALAGPAPAFAQGPAGPTSPDAPQAARTSDIAAPQKPKGATTLTEVVVTARKRAENLQDVPVAVTALSGVEVAKQNALTISNLSLTVPAFKVTVAPAEGSALILQIRGQAQGNNSSTLDPSVGIYVDGVYWARPTGADAALTDVSSVNVLKGPQGTLFGRATTGGALVITTNDPDPTKFSGLLSATGASYGEADGSIILNAPIVQDKLAVRLAVTHNGNDGYVYNTTTQERDFSQDDTTIRLKVLARPTDKSQILFSYENFSLSAKSDPFQLSYVKPNSPAFFLDLIKTGGNLADSVGGSSHTTAVDNDQRESVHDQTVSVTGSYDFGIGVLKLIGAYRKENNLNDAEITGAPVIILGEQSKATVEQESGEAQFTGKLFSNRLDYTLGAFWFKEAGTDTSTFFALPGLNPNNPQNTSGFVDNRSQAVYAQGSYKLTDAVSLTGGVRYSVDHKSLLSSNSVQTANGFACLEPALLGGSDPAACHQEFGVSSSDVDYTVSLDYKIARDVLGYLKVAHGYRPGGLQLNGNTTAVSFQPFRPESVLNYEAGLKSEFLGRRLRVNLAGYYTDYSDIQRTITVATPSGGTASLITNAASGKVYGGELETQALVTDSLRLGATLSVIEASYDSYQDLLGDHSREAFPYTPEIQYSLTADYTRSVPGGRANAHVDWGYQSSELFFAGYSNGTVGAVNLPTSAIRSGPYGLLNFRVAYRLDHPDIEFAVFGRNALDKLYRTGTVDLVDAGIGVSSVQHGAPAVFGVQATYRFGG